MNKYSKKNSRNIEDKKAAKEINEEYFVPYR